MNTSSMRSTTNPFVGKMERSHWQYEDPDHVQTWGPTRTLARRPTEPRLNPCKDDQDLSIQEHVVQPQGLPKWARLELKNSIIQGQLTVPWIIRPNCWPNFFPDQKIQM